MTLSSSLAMYSVMRDIPDARKVPMERGWVALYLYATCKFSNLLTLEQWAFEYGLPFFWYALYINDSRRAEEQKKHQNSHFGEDQLTFTSLQLMPHLMHAQPGVHWLPTHASYYIWALKIFPIKSFHQPPGETVLHLLTHSALYHIEMWSDTIILDWVF